jgi:hypothetical protein
MTMAASGNQSAPPKHIGRDARLLIYAIQKTRAPDLKSAVPKERPTIARRFNAGYRTIVSKSQRDGRIGHLKKAEFHASSLATRACSRPLCPSAPLENSALKVYKGLSRYIKVYKGGHPPTSAEVAFRKITKRTHFGTSNQPINTGGGHYVYQTSGQNEPIYKTGREKGERRG